MWSYPTGCVIPFYLEQRKGRRCHRLHQTYPVLPAARQGHLRPPSHRGAPPTVIGELGAPHLPWPLFSQVPVQSWTPTFLPPLPRSPGVGHSVPSGFPPVGAGRTQDPCRPGQWNRWNRWKSGLRTGHRVPSEDFNIMTPVCLCIKTAASTGFLILSPISKALTLLF